MAYERYIKKNGKVYGPYVQHNKKVDGKVVTEYRGKRKQNSGAKKSRRVMKIGKTSSLIFILFLLIIFNSIFSFSLDSETIIIGGGDSEAFVDYIGDEEVFFIGDLNELPTVTLVAPDDENTTTDRTPTFNWTGSDDDGDSLEYEINITLIASSLCTDPDRGAIGISDENYTVPNYLKCLYDNGDYYNWSVRASDDSGVTYGAWSSVRRININSDIIITLPVDAINFGSMITGMNDTSDDVPAPFVIQNDGNCYVNVTTNATNLWVEASNPSDYFEYKIDNNSGEEGAFDWLESKISWQQIPITDETSIVELNWSDLVDSAEIDLNITVPSQEVAGNKESTVYFTASLGE